MQTNSAASSPKMDQNKTPVLEKVQGRMSGGLKEEKWPNLRETDVMDRKEKIQRRD